MASNGKKKTTMAKLNREHKVREKQMEKKAKREARKREALNPSVDVAETTGEEEPESLDHLDRFTTDAQGRTPARA